MNDIAETHFCERGLPQIRSLEKNNGITGSVPCILSRKSTKQPSHLKYLKEQKRCGYLETKNSCLELRDNVLLRMDLLSVDAVDAFCAQSDLMEYGIWFAGDMKKIQVDVIYPQFLKKLY